MADHPEAFGPDEPSPLPEGEFKSEFFGSVGSKPSPEPQPATLAALRTEPPEAHSGHPAFPVILGAVFLGVIAVAAVVNRASTTEPAAPAPAAAAEAPAPVVEAPAKEADVKALAESVKAEIANLSKEIKDLDGRISALPKPTPPADLSPLNNKVAALGRSIEALQPLSQNVDALDGRLGGLSTSFKSLQEGNASLKGQVAALRDEMKKSIAAAVAAATAEATTTREAAKPVNVNVEGQSFAQAAELFKAGRYKEASEVLKTTEENDPKDARVWYYAALSAGLSTNEWRGNTEKLVMKGVECEKAGTPAVGDIDAEFAKLPAAQKAWLDAYRKLAQNPQ